MAVPEALKAAVESDLNAKRREYLFRLPRRVEAWLQGLLQDPRDLPVALLLANILLTTVPLAACVAVSNSHLLGALYLIGNDALYLQRYLVALLHVSEHRELFRKGDPRAFPFQRCLCSRCHNRSSPHISS